MVYKKHSVHVYTLGRWIPQGGPLKQEQINRGEHKGARDLEGWEPQTPEQKSFSLRAEAQMGRKETRGSYVSSPLPQKGWPWIRSDWTEDPPYM